MPTHVLYSNPVNVVNKEFFAPNDATPSPTGMSKVASAFNYVACTQKKTIMIRAQDHLSATGTAIDIVWPHYWRTGEGTTAVVVRLGMAPSTVSTVSNVSYQVRVFSAGDETDTLVESVTHQLHGTLAAGALSPNDIIERTFVVKGLSPNTEYHARFVNTNSARIVYATVHEGWEVRADDAVTGVCNPDKFHAEGPIYDEHAQDLTEANNKLWRHNGAPYIGWSGDYAAGSLPSTTSAVLGDIFTGCGQYIDATYHTTRNRTTVPVKMGVRAFASGTPCTADFRLTDGTNNIDITGCVLSTATSAKWFTTTANIPASIGTWRMQFRLASGANTVFVDGWALFPYEA